MKKRIGIVLAGVIVVLLGRGFFYYGGLYSGVPTEMPNYEGVTVPEAFSSQFAEAVEKSKGTILIDLAHENSFDAEELNVLISRLIARGLTIEFFRSEDNLKQELLGEKEGEADSADEKLQPADAYVVVCPGTVFVKEEIETIEQFVRDGGKLLLVADPTRSGQVNSLSLSFGLIFEPDYLYNMKDNDANYRNIFVTEFGESEITKNLARIVLYTAGSITSDNYGIAWVDENTSSSLIETKKKLSPVALAVKSKVLAIYDLTFLTEPYNGVWDNNQFISNIAQWLATPVREKKIEVATK